MLNEIELNLITLILDPELDPDLSTTCTLVSLLMKNNYLFLGNGIHHSSEATQFSAVVCQQGQLVNVGDYLSFTYHNEVSMQNNAYTCMHNSNNNYIHQLHECMTYLGRGGSLPLWSAT